MVLLKMTGLTETYRSQDSWRHLRSYSHSVYVFFFC